MAKLPFDIIYETDQFIAVNKPAGLLSIPDREQSEKSLKDMLLEKYGSIYTVHRLDKDTSGIIIFAKSTDAHQYFSQLFESRNIEKIYYGIVLGKPIESSGLIEAPIAEHPTQKGTMTIHRNGKPSQTKYEVIESFPSHALVSFQLLTGRTHQIRVHAKQLGNPLACDPLYGDGKPILLSMIKRNYKLSKVEETETPMLSRVALHAMKLHFTEPGGNEVTLEAPLPKELRAIMQQLKKRYQN